jgi:hypothetical protein
MAEEPKVQGPYPQWKIVIRRPKAQEAAVPRMSMTPDPRKPTAQAPEMEVWREIPVSMQHKDGTERTEKEREELFRQIVVKSRPNLPRDCAFDLALGVPFWWIMEGVPEITNCCPNHPEQRDNFCRKCGKSVETGFKTT